MNKIYDGIMGLVVGDTLGVPVEFQSREQLNTHPIKDMRGFGTYNQPAGTWSDDSSMALATLESIIVKGKIDPADIMENFCQWLFCGEFTPHGEVFDVGGTTHLAIEKYKNGVNPLKCGGKSIVDNGNGSLMRILPLAFVQHSLADIINVSSLTHAHETSVVACVIYISIVDELLTGKDKETAVKDGISKIAYAMTIPKQFVRLPVIQYVNRDAIKSSGYVVDTLEAAIWCFLHSKDYSSCVLAAANLGNDTDTVAAVAGGLAGIFYGSSGIPDKWISQIARKDWIKSLCNSLR